MSLLTNMPHRCTIRRLIHQSGSMAGSKTSPVNEQTDVECWEQSAGHAEVLEYQKRGMRITHKVYFSTDPFAANSPRSSERRQILVTARGGVAVASPIPLDVKSEARPDAGAGSGVVFKVMCDLSTGSDD